MAEDERKHYVLVVDDNTDIRYLLKKGLEIEGYEVETAENGLDAQTKIQNSRKPCVILLDLMMPVMDGWEFLEWKKQTEEISHLPVGLLSAVTKDKRPTEGIAGYFPKPVNFSHMLEFIKAHC